MIVSRLELVDFRNYSSGLFELTEDTTAVLGDNGQGKTNLAEALGTGLDTFATNVINHAVQGVSDALVETIAGGDSVWEGGDSGDDEEDDKDDGGGDTIGEYGEGFGVLDAAGPEADPVLRIEDEALVSSPPEIDEAYASDTDASGVDVSFDS